MNKLPAKIIQAGAIVGTLDILSAFVYSAIKNPAGNPLVVLNYISSALFGKEAYSGGTVMMLTGLVLHYIIAFTFTIFFFWLFPRIKALSKNTVLTGIVYGLFIWAVMNLIVVPSSKIPHRPFIAVNAMINMIILIVCIGLPLSFMANAFYKKINTRT